MTARGDFRRACRDALLDQEGTLSDLRAALAALHLIASASEGIEKDDMDGLRHVTGGARELAAALHRSWREALERVDARGRSEA